VAKVTTQSRVQFHCEFTAELDEALDAYVGQFPYRPSKVLIVEDLLRAALGLSNYQVASGMLRGGGRR
jgi:hypothetical protein